MILPFSHTQNLKISWKRWRKTCNKRWLKKLNDWGITILTLWCIRIHHRTYHSRSFEKEIKTYTSWRYIIIENKIRYQCPEKPLSTKFLELWTNSRVVADFAFLLDVNQWENGQFQMSNWKWIIMGKIDLKYIFFWKISLRFFFYDAETRSNKNWHRK